MYVNLSSVLYSVFWYKHYYLIVLRYLLCGDCSWVVFSWLSFFVLSVSFGFQIRTIDFFKVNDFIFSSLNKAFWNASRSWQMMDKIHTPTNSVCGIFLFHPKPMTIITNWSRLHFLPQHIIKWLFIKILDRLCCILAYRRWISQFQICQSGISRCIIGWCF